MSPIIMTLPVFQSPRGWLNEGAPQNMKDISATAPVSHSPMG